jgi:hypothetical protein
MCFPSECVFWATRREATPSAALSDIRAAP